MAKLPGLPFFEFLAVIVTLLTLGVAFGWKALLPAWYIVVGLALIILVLRDPGR